MRSYLVALVCVCAVIGELTAANSSSEAWRLYKRQYGKVYEAEEDAMRFANFLTTKQLVERHNANSNATYKMRLNHMADWSHNKFEQPNGLKFRETQDQLSNTRLSVELSQLLERSVPNEVDWRKVPNRVTAVRDQKLCSSDWAFATTGLLEGQQVPQNYSKLTLLSAQELIDCSVSNQGCGSGFPGPVDALNDIAKIGIIQSEEDYPYEALDGLCAIDPTDFKMKVKGGTLLKKNDEEALLKAVANYGPVAVVIDTTDNFRFYDSGVFTDPTCKNSGEYNHARHLLAVGYGTDTKGGDYWLLKNSWGADWGEEGYIRLKRGGNICGIARIATVAEF